MTFQPFKNDTQSTSIEDLTLENNADRLSIFGSINITADKDGLSKAQELHKILTDAISHLTELSEARQLPDQIEQAPSTEVDNPFLD